MIDFSKNKNNIKNNNINYLQNKIDEENEEIIFNSNSFKKIFLNNQNINEGELYELNIEEFEKIYNSFYLKTKKKNSINNFPFIDREKLYNFFLVISNNEEFNLNYLNFNIQSLQTLNKENWVNDQIINNYAKLITKRSNNNLIYKKIHIFNTFFYQKIANKNSDYFYNELENDKKEYNKFFILKKKPLDINKFDLLLFPINLCNLHWSLITINLKEQTIIYYDSLIKIKHSIIKREMKKIIKVLSLFR